MTAPPREYGCHCDIEAMPDGFEPDGCVFDGGLISECTYAIRLQREGKGRDDCEYWRPIVRAPAPSADRPAAQPTWTVCPRCQNNIARCDCATMNNPAAAQPAELVLPCAIDGCKQPSLMPASEYCSLHSAIGTSPTGGEFATQPAEPPATDDPARGLTFAGAIDYWRNIAEKAMAERDTLRADAERYWWLRDTPWPDELIPIIRQHRNGLWDAAIDAARAKVPK